MSVMAFQTHSSQVSMTSHLAACCVSRNDISGARHAGCHAWLWGADVRSFGDVAADIQEFNSAFTAEHG